MTITLLLKIFRLFQLLLSLCIPQRHTHPNQPREPLMRQRLMSQLLDLEIIHIRLLRLFLAPAVRMALAIPKAAHTQVCRLRSTILPWSALLS